MQKTVSTDAYDFGEPQLAQVPLTQAKRQLGPNDTAAMLKRASSDLLHKLASVKFRPGEVPVHLIAVGCTEAYGPNRNGDGFREKVCQEWHPTFLKYAKFFRNHKSDSANGDPHYGVVKISHYNPDMRRIELIVALNGDEETARSNHGRVADIELRKLAEGRDVPTSMGCRVSFDVCSGCGHKAKIRDHYCTAQMCKAGGLKHNMGMLLDDGSILHADNPDPRFNDISYVPRQADRISYVLGVMQKAAAAGGRAPFISGAELAEMVYAPVYVHRWTLAAQKVATVEEDLTRYLPLAGGVSAAGRQRDFVGIPTDTVPKLAQALAALADEGIILPAEEFVSLFSGRRPEVVGQLKQACHGLFSRLTPPPTNPYEHRGPVAFAYRGWAGQLTQDYSLKEAAVRRRLALASIRETETTDLAPLTKTAAENPLVEELAQQYGMYVLAALDRPSFRNSNLPLTAAMALLQNRLR